MNPKPYKPKFYNLETKNGVLALGVSTCIMGILNVTPDSFSDGGRYFSLDDALERARQLIADGADILDIGGESSRPFSEPVSEAEELRRVIPVIEHLAGNLDVPISIDTTKASVAKRAMEAGAAMINDISALRFDPDMAAVVADTGAPVVLMHMLGSPKDMQVDPSYDDLMGEIHRFLERAVLDAEKAGISRAKIIIDPGIGFGKTVAHNLELIRRLERFSDLGVPILAGPSRKAFIRKLLAGKNQLENDPDASHDMVETGTVAAVCAAILNGAHIVRVHDVARARAAATIADAVKNAQQ